MSYKKSVKNPDESFDGISSVFSSKENKFSSCPEKNSRAYAAAMKALQEKLLEVESQNSSLRLRISELETKRQTEKHGFDIQMLEERQKLEKIFKQKINDLELSDKASQKTIKKLTDTIKLLEVKLKFNEDQVTQLQEQFTLDKENLHLELQCAKKALTDSKTLENTVTDQLLKSKREKKLYKSQLSEQNKLIHSLQSEIDFLKDQNKEHHLRIEQNFKTIKSELLLKNQENLLMIKQLNLKNKNLQRLASDSKKQGEYFKVQCIKLSQRARESQDLASDLKKNKSKPKISDSNKSSNRRSASSIRYYETPELINTDEESIGKAIFSKEGEIKRLSDRYHRLQSVQFDTHEIEAMQRNLEDICVNMDQKNKELSELKQKQRERLRLKLAV